MLMSLTDAKVCLSLQIRARDTFREIECKYKHRDCLCQRDISWRVCESVCLLVSVHVFGKDVCVCERETERQA